jgi:hypothetical protein
MPNCPILFEAQCARRGRYGQVQIKAMDRLAVYCVQDMEMQLNEREALLVDAFRRLPPDAATELSALAERLAQLVPNHRIDWSDSWSDEDLKEFRAASLRRLEAEESEDKD